MLSPRIGDVVCKLLGCSSVWLYRDNLSRSRSRSLSRSRSRSLSRSLSLSLSRSLSRSLSLSRSRSLSLSRSLTTHHSPLTLTTRHSPLNLQPQPQPQPKPQPQLHPNPNQVRLYHDNVLSRAPGSAPTRWHCDDGPAGYMAVGGPQVGRG